MANYLVMFSAPENHIDFMLKNSGVSRDYYVGEPPEPEEPEPEKVSVLARLFGKKPKDVEPTLVVPPDDWPEGDADTIDIEINHRNVDLYHWILNQTPDPVDGSGSIFQTWFHPTHAALSLDNCSEAFAFKPSQLPELLLLVQRVTPELVKDAFTGWCAAEGKDHVPTLEEATEMYEGFLNFGAYLKTAIAKQHGLVWVVS